jgi:hypothetical protein
MLQCVSQQKTILIRYCTSIAPKDETNAFRVGEIEKNLPKFIPQNLTLGVVLLNKSEGSDTHNRYILTERGGIKFPWGLDTQADKKDTVNVMEKETHQAKFNEYQTLATHAVARILKIKGTAN